MFSAAACPNSKWEKSKNVPVSVGKLKKKKKKKSAFMKPIAYNF